MFDRRKATGASLAEAARARVVNPFFLAYAYATGARSAPDAIERDGSVAPFIAWNSKRWAETRQRTGSGGSCCCPDCEAAHLDTLAAYVRAA